jgi:hypothetical protein
MNSVMNIQVPLTTGNILTRSRTVSRLVGLLSKYSNYTSIMAVTVVLRSKARNVCSHSATAIVGSNPT